MKKIMVVSDTHKHHRNLARALEQAGTPDLLIHLGDAEGYEDYIADMAGCPLEIVSDVYKRQVRGGIYGAVVCGSRKTFRVQFRTCIYNV